MVKLELQSMGSCDKGLDERNINHPVVWLDGHTSEEENPCFDLGMGAQYEHAVWKEPRRTACRWMSDLCRLESASSLKVWQEISV